MMRALGFYPDLSNEEYHSDEHYYSSSQIKLALHSPELFKRCILDKKGKKKESDAMDKGTALHTLLLEPHKFNDEYIVFDTKDIKKNTKEGKALWKAMEEEANGRIILSKETYEELLEMRESAYRHPDARKILEADGVVEGSFFTEIEHMLPSGEIVPVQVRVRPDKLMKDYFIDLKSTKNPLKSAFKRDAVGEWGFHYDLSLALYTKALAPSHDGKLLPSKLLAVRNNEPYETCVYRLGEDSYKSGEAKLSKALTTIIMCQRNGIWQSQMEEEEI